MTSDVDGYTKVVDLNEIYNFIVDAFLSEVI
jgi:hypothetical protein